MAEPEKVVQETAEASSLTRFNESQSSGDNTYSKGPRFLCVDYPGVVKNVEKGIDTLGGLNKMAYDHYKTGALELDYHRDNIYSRPSVSRQIPGTCLLVKIRRKKPKSSDDIERSNGEPHQEKPQNPSNNEDVEGEILGVVSSMHRFSTMFDFQYLPLKRSTHAEQSQQPVFEDILPKLFPTDLYSVQEWVPEENATSQDTDLFLPPYAFSRFTLPNFQVLGREPQQIIPTRGTIAAASGSATVGQSLRKERRYACCIVHGHDPFPTSPPAIAVSQADARCKLTKPHELIKEIFEERPLWSKSAVLFLTGVEETLVKVLLPKYAFYIFSGPFGRLWCRFGFDPRLERSSARYQSIMVNLSKLGFGGKDAMRIAYKVPATNRLKVTSRGIQSSRDMPLSKAKKSWYTFESGILPPFRQVWYQVMDVKLPVADEEIEKAMAIEDPIYRDGHSEPTSAGWLLLGATDRIRDAIKRDLKSTLDKMDQEIPSTSTGIVFGEESMSSDDDDSQDDEDLDYVRTTGLPQASLDD